MSDLTRGDMYRRCRAVVMCLCIKTSAQDAVRSSGAPGITDTVVALKNAVNFIRLINFDVLLTVHLSIFISVINKLYAQNFCFKIRLFNVLSQPVHQTATYRCDDTRGCVMQL